jgi:hypothetical protein
MGEKWAMLYVMREKNHNFVRRFIVFARSSFCKGRKI